MINSDTAKERIITDPAAQKALTDWFSVLSERNIKRGGKSINGRAWRAELRRMEPPYDVMMCEGYNVLRRQLSLHMALQPVDQMALALFVSVAVHVTTHQAKPSFAAQLGEKIKNNPCLSALRFQRLQQATDPQIFCQQLIRAVKIRGKEGVNIISLADSIFLWMREWQDREENKLEPVSPFMRNRIRWANEYLSTANQLFL